MYSMPQLSKVTYKVDAYLHKVHTKIQIISLSIQLQQPMLTIRQTLQAQRSSNKRHSPQNTQKQWTIKDFQIYHSLGKGRFGQVFVARQKNSQYVVALKRMGKQQIEQSNFMQQVKREIIIQSSLHHPNILKLFGYFWDTASVYLILQQAPEGQLYGLLKKKGRLSEGTVSAIVRQVMQGLNYLHSRNIIHRDIKPENILLSGGRVKIADFGWSIYTSRRRETVCGTLDYLPPEMVLGETHDFKVDVWGVGILAYELVTGRPPFQDKTQLQTYQRIVEEQVDFPGYVSVELRTFIRKCLQKDPERRLSVAVLLQDPFIGNHANSQVLFD